MATGALSFPPVPSQPPPSGRGPVDAHQQSSSARNPPQNAIIIPRAIGVRSHQKECTWVRNQKDHFPVSSSSDLDIFKDDLVYSYIDADGVSTVTDSSGETKIFSGINGMPKQAKIGFEGAAVSNFVANDITKRATIAYQKSGFRMVHHSGNKVGRTGDWYAFRKPCPKPGGYMYRGAGNGGTKIVPETIPLRLVMKEFSRPITDAVQDLRSWIMGIPDGRAAAVLDDDAEMKQVGRQLRNLLASGTQPNVAQFCKALTVDVHTLRNMLEKGAFDHVDGVSEESDAARNSYRAGAKFFLWAFKKTEETRDPDLAWLHVYEQQIEFLQSVNLSYINERRATCIGQGLSVALPNGGDLALNMSRTF